MSYLLVALGAGIGGGLRYYVSSVAYKYLPVYFPFGTLAVNVMGSIVLGILIFGLDERELLNQNLKLLLGVGFCGGFTTFSTFSLETINLMLDSEYLLMIINIVSNVLISVLGIFLGYVITR
jgi:CrcB protein